MALQVVRGAQLCCSFGTSLASLAVLPLHRVDASEQDSATIQDHVPILNIPPFGMCQCPANPEVAAATAAALGVLTPQPCIPVTSSPWAPGAPTVLIDNQPALDDASTCQCMWGGVISVTDAGQTAKHIP